MSYRILALGPHPDDLELGCGGMLALAIERDNIVSMATWQPVQEEGGAPQPYAAERIMEARRAAELLGAGFLELRDHGPKSVASLVRQLQPHFVLCTWPEDVHPFHQQIGTWCREGIYLAQLTTANLPYKPWRVAQLLWYQTYSTLYFHPHFYIDVTHQYTIAVKALKTHERGIQILPVLPHAMLVMHLDAGLHAGVAYAEGFRFECQGWFNNVCERNQLWSLLTMLNAGH